MYLPQKRLGVLCETSPFFFVIKFTYEEANKGGDVSSAWSTNPKPTVLSAVSFGIRGCCFDVLATARAKPAGLFWKRWMRRNRKALLLLANWNQRNSGPACLASSWALRFWCTSCRRRRPRLLVRQPGSGTAITFTLRYPTVLASLRWPCGAKGCSTQLWPSRLRPQANSRLSKECSLSLWKLSEVN